MEDYILIPAQDFCVSHQVTVETLRQLNDYGLIEVVQRKQTVFIPESQLKRLEQILVFHKELEINLEGIETIFELLERIEKMQNHIIQLENKLKRFI
ncbi:MerR family transcriptional regulator [Dokdonia sinensis]|uniref:MerR family transcriptional regulator n=1 Tax=Dokdonia sinensis TaxID=2479847 RepID=A0A3M0GGQ6_9FLAO|nr:chaperone modulator CbpM [Dokdonia sinensis]RMB64115.1 MerR family transcriptional regulator [Dokdonia sinensis]